MKIEERKDIKNLFAALNFLANINKFSMNTGIRLDKGLLKFFCLFSLPTFIKNLGFFQGIKYLVKILIGRGEGKIRLKNMKFPLFVRYHTSDPFVLNSVFFSGDYEKAKGLPGISYILDAGAYVGYTSLYFASHYPQARVIAVEPEANNYALLARHAQLLDNITPVNAALWSHDGTISFTPEEDIRKRDYWGVTVGESSRESSGKSLNAKRVETLLAEHQIDRFHILKIDIEGAEKEVIDKNSSAWFEKSKLAFVELHEQFYPGCSHGFFELVNHMPCHVDIHGEKLIVRPQQTGNQSLL